MIETTLTQSSSTQRGMEAATSLHGESIDGPTGIWHRAEHSRALSLIYVWGYPIGYTCGRSETCITGNYRFYDNASRRFLSFVSGFNAGTVDLGIDALRVLEDPDAILMVSSRSSHFDFGLQSPSQVYSPVRVLETGLAAAHALGPLDIGLQLAKLKSLRDGWADGMQPAHQWDEQHGKAPSAEGLNWLADQFDSHYAAGLPKPYIYPTPEGGVQAEWSLGPNEVSLEIDLASHSAEWHCLNLETDVSSEKDLDLNGPDSWRWIALEIGGLERNA